MNNIIRLTDILETNSDECYAECGECGSLEFRIKINRHTWQTTLVVCAECGSSEEPDYEIEFPP